MAIERKEVQSVIDYIIDICIVKGSLLFLLTLEKGRRSTLEILEITLLGNEPWGPILMRLTLKCTP